MFTGTAEELCAHEAQARETAEQAAALLDQIDGLDLGAGGGPLHPPGGGIRKPPRPGPGPSLTEPSEEGDRGEHRSRAPRRPQEQFLVLLAVEDVAASGNNGEQLAALLTTALHGLALLRTSYASAAELTTACATSRLAEVFGLDEKTAMRYADSARSLLEQAAEQHLR